MRGPTHAFGAGPRRPATGTLPLCLGFPFVLALEALDPAGCVNQLLLPGEEGVAFGAHLHADMGPGGAGVDNLPTRAGNRGLDVFRMNACLHGTPPCKQNTLPIVPKKRKKLTHLSNSAGWIAKGAGSDPGRPRSAYPSWFMELRNSLLVLVSLSLSNRSSIASTGLSWERAFRRSQTF